MSNIRLNWTLHPYRPLTLLRPFLPVRDVWLLVDETLYDPDEREERLVDHARLPLPDAGRAGLASVLRPGQVHEVQLPLDVLLLKVQSSSYGVKLMFKAEVIRLKVLVRRLT